MKTKFLKNYSILSYILLSVKEKVFPTLALPFLVSPPEFSNKLKEKDDILTRKVDAYVAKISFQNSVVNH